MQGRAGLAQEFHRRRDGPGLGPRGEEAAEGDVVGALSLGPDGAPEFVVAGQADEGPGTEQCAGAVDGGIVTSQVHAIRPGRGGQFRIVIDDEQAAVFMAQPAQGLGLFQPPPGIALFVTVLQQACAALQHRARTGDQVPGRQQAGIGDGVKST